MRHVTAAFPGRFYEVMLPAPLHSGCNPMVKHDTPLHADACQLAKIACVIGRYKPLVFPAFHDWMMAGSSPPSLEAVLSRARELLPGIDVTVAVERRENLKPLEIGILVFQANLKRNQLEGLPLLLTEKGTLLGAPADADALVRYFR
jgi:hypothetical protein